MHPIMTQLHQDHKHLARVLAVMNQQLNIIASGEDPDLRLLIDSAEYIQHYSDLVHHTKENQVFDCFTNISDEASEVIDVLRQDHKQLPALTIDFHTMLEGALNGAMFVSKNKLHKKIQDFVDAQKIHMTMEDTQLFPLIEKTLSEDDWSNLDKIIFKTDDPLFGNDLERCYEDLYQSIKSLSMLD